MYLCLPHPDRDLDRHLPRDHQPAPPDIWMSNLCMSNSLPEAHCRSPRRPRWKHNAIKQASIPVAHMRRQLLVIKIPPPPGWPSYSTGWAIHDKHAICLGVVLPRDATPALHLPQWDACAWTASYLIVYIYIHDPPGSAGGGSRGQCYLYIHISTSMRRVVQPVGLLTCLIVG
jgi:hypothetical protein